MTVEKGLSLRKVKGRVLSPNFYWELHLSPSTSIYFFKNGKSEFLASSKIWKDINTIIVRFIGK